MTIFVWFMLSLFVLWFVVGVYLVLTETKFERLMERVRTGRTRTGKLHMGRVFVATAVPFVGIGACLGYLFG